MKSSAPVPQSIDQYIAGFPEPVRARLEAVRSIIRRAAPDAIEKISYRIPTFYLNGNLVHFAAFKNHIGFFPTGRGVSAFEKELKGYKHATGSIQFPMDQPLPLKLIRRIVALRVKQNDPRKSSAARPRTHSVPPRKTRRNEKLK